MANSSQAMKIIQKSYLKLGLLGLIFIGVVVTRFEGNDGIILDNALSFSFTGIVMLLYGISQESKRKNLELNRN
jgi:hypothetical protein